VKENCDVLVLYGDPSTRDQAVRFCDLLVQRFWADHKFNVEWCPLADLASEREARERAELAARARLVVFSIQPGGNVSWEFRDWVESWIPSRCECEGALVGLLDCAEAEGIYSYLREVAHRANMDYLTQVPDAISHQDSMESFSQRATQQTSVLQEILSTRGHHMMDESLP
jgi:hypothetical protein